LVLEFVCESCASMVLKSTTDVSRVGDTTGISTSGDGRMERNGPCLRREMDEVDSTRSRWVSEEMSLMGTRSHKSRVSIFVDSTWSEKRPTG